MFSQQSVLVISQNLSWLYCFQYAYVDVRLCLSQQFSASLCCHFRLICPGPSVSEAQADVT